MMKEKLVTGIKVNGKVMREIQNTIYIPFGANYSIFLKNLNTKKAQVNIEIDGEDILDGNALIIDSNSSLNLERWLVGGLKTGPKLKFVQKTEQIRGTKEETLMDGIVKISYRFEKRIVYQEYTTLYNQPYYYGNQPYYYGNQPYVYFNSGETPNVFKPVTTCHVSGEHIVSDDVSLNSYQENEDGMTVKGGDINQRFQEGYIGSLEYAEHVICFNLKGDINQKSIEEPITVKTKINCSKCNFSNKSSYRFCTQCGNNLFY